MRSCGSVLDDVGGRPFHAVLAASLRSVREAMDKISSRFESRDATRRRIEAESEAVGRDVEDALRYALSQKRKAEAEERAAAAAVGPGSGVNSGRDRRWRRIGTRSANCPATFPTRTSLDGRQVTD